MSGAADVVGFQNCVSKEIVLQAQVVLIDVGRSQVWVDQKDGAATVDGKKLPETDIGCGRRGGKWVGYAQTDTVTVRVKITRILIRLIKIACGPALRRANAVEEETRLRIKRDLAVELQVIFALQDVIKKSEAAADAGLAASGGVPGKAEAGRKVLLIGEVHAGWRPGIAGEHHPQRRVGKSLRLQSWNHRKAAALSVGFGRVVFVTQTHREHKILAYMQLVLAKYISALAAYVGKGKRSLKIGRRGSEQKVGVGIPGSVGTTKGIEVEFSIREIVEDQVLLVRGESGSELPVIFSLSPRNRIGPGKGVLHEARRSLLTGTKLIAGVEKDVRGASGEVWCNADAEAGSRGQLLGHTVLQKIAAMSHKVKLIQ